VRIAIASSLGLAQARIHVQLSTMAHAYNWLGRVVLVVTLAFGSGCGGDEGPAQNLAGTVQGRSLGPVLSTYVVPDDRVPTSLSLIIDEAPTGCGPRPAGGEKLAIIFPCGIRKGYVAVTAPTSVPPSCTGREVANALLEEGSGFDIAGATGGEVNVNDDGSRLKGTFSIAFGDERLRGSFDAARCSGP
jgi:hypothetical protein